jgi:3-oxoacyl-(acyl-carrier-protein) synthase
LPGVAHSTMWGLGRVLAMEHPNLNCLLADLDPGAENGTLAAQIEDLLRLFRTPDRESLVAWRDGKRYVARLAAREDLAESTSSMEIAADAAYLITGGMGGIGLLLAEWLVEQGARRLVLTGRGAPREAALQKIGALEEAGAEVRIIRGDIGSPQDSQRIMEQIRESGVPLRGVIHAAGLTDDAPLLDLDWARCVKVLQPKMAGVWNLHEGTRSEPLDFFVCFSSVSSVIGSQGHGNYAPANAFLDAMAHHRRALGLPCVSMNWGPWAGVGLASRLTGEMRQRWDALGIYGSLEASAALRAFGKLLGASETQIAIMPTQWSRFFQLFPLGLEPPFLEKLAQKHKRRQPPSREWVDLMEAARSAPAAARREILTSYVEKQAAAVLRLPAETKFDLGKGFFELGMDSLMSVEFRNRLQVAAGTAHVFAVTLIFDRPNIGALVDYLDRDAVGTKTRAVEVLPKDRPSAEEPIAVIGMACRFPNGASSPEAFWQRLRDGFDAIEEVPASRWPIDDYFDPDPQAPGKMYTRFGAFVGDIDRFDAHFFGISPREALHMDPQQRMLLETTYHALENACQAVPRLRESRTGVFVGISVNDYVQVLSRSGDPASIDAYLGTGNALSMAAGRISHSLGLQGPSMSVDTACSSSLVAVHLACESLRTGNADMALAGGVNAILVPEVNISLSKARMLAPDGRCKTFDAGADGYVRGEGCGMVVLKRLSDARRDGDPILAVIRGSAINHDGRSSEHGSR